MDSFTLFNILEGVFWIGMGIQSWVLSKMLDKSYWSITIFATGAFIFFGISDFLEIRMEGFIGVWWLIAWKILGILGFLTIFIWYIKLRIKLPRQNNAPQDVTTHDPEMHMYDLFQCPACKMRYKDKKWADECFAWCKEHHSCNIDIIKHAVKI